MVILVASDQHLGYENSNADAFRSFLAEVTGRADVEALVILGDFIDMWRRDASGLFLEFNDVVRTILGLKGKVPVYCVGGNHDFHLNKLVRSSYPLSFQKDLTLPSGSTTYVFKHGWEFDLEQREPVMELLCQNFSDDAGNLRSGLWDALKAIKGDLDDSVQDLLEIHGSGDNYLQNLMTPPNQRLSANLSDVESRALSSVQPGQILVFGHTHRPFVSASGNVANSGSWVSDEQVTNTFVELDGSSIKVMQQGKGDITDSVRRS